MIPMKEEPIKKEEKWKEEIIQIKEDIMKKKEEETVLFRPSLDKPSGILNRI